MMQQQQAAAPQAKLKEIVVASENLAHGAQITKDRFKLEKWPEDRLPPGAVSKLKTWWANIRISHSIW